MILRHDASIFLGDIERLNIGGFCIFCGSFLTLGDFDDAGIWACYGCCIDNNVGDCI